MKKSGIVYFYSSRSTFVENDIEILQSKYTVMEHRFDGRNKKLTPLVYLKQFFYLARNIFSCKMMIVMFGGHQSLLPALFGKITGKPCLIICGGTDCVSFPSIGYGNFRGGLLALVTRWSYKLATHLSPVHPSLMEYDYTYDDSDFKKQGILAFMPDLKTPCTVINYGFDPEKWTTAPERIPNSFVTVAAGLEKPYRAKLKGIDLIIKVAEYFPQAQFTIIGCPENYKLPFKTANVKTYSFVSSAALKDIYNEHEFYLQVSMSEGFPNAICEAMSCGCIPIGSRVGGITDIIGDTGFILVKRNIDLFKELLGEALNCDRTRFSAKARSRIMQNYPKDLRKVQLLKLVGNLLG
jgi:glycosyltransferase involved in cell wall biosynthesis